eukprot:TCONS_00040487-protein
MRKLKICTGDDVYLVLYKDGLKSDSTVFDKLGLGCQECGAEWRGPMVIALDSKWIGGQRVNPDGKNCDRWNHAKCLGLEFVQNVKSVKWFFPIHRTKPPKRYLKKALAEMNKKQKPLIENPKTTTTKKPLKKTSKK